MIDDDMWVLWRLSTQQNLENNSFECSLVLESSDGSPLEVIDINIAEVHAKSWLRLVRQEAPFDIISDIDIPIKNNLSLFLSGFIDVEALIKLKPDLAYIYLWASAKHEKIYLETLYPLSKLNEKAESRDFSKNCIQIYPETPSQKYVDLEDQILEAKDLSHLLTIIQHQVEEVTVVKELEITEEIITESEVDQNSFDIEMLDSNDVDSVWGIFAKQDLDDLVEGFNDWQRVHGKNTLIARLPKRLSNKLDGEFNVVFWTSGQGISNMIVDDKPPRHTMVLGITNRSGDQGIGYCIQRPTSLDKMWTHQKWHSLECSNSEILRVEPVNF
ncbi:hypothetical protein FQ082_07125 [Psychrobacter sp. ANT_H56B]|uniref:hypothetical protein n=1 Tax=Psychrobacter sp. ANT_H56B TaxID=2597353 RepID=UPI0011F22F06|nr:hypothetical protein [Psychrobacter sp. ANT_H56B]KAA0926903.1 hypothetical protein FQ082_07125 [Psychrobacter sp. ANT_H56B]